MEIGVVILYENELPCQIIGVYDNHEKAYKAICDDADEIIRDMKNEGYEYFRNEPNIENYPACMVTEDANFGNEINNGTVYSYVIVCNDINKKFEFPDIDYL